MGARSRYLSTVGWIILFTVLTINVSSRADSAPEVRGTWVTMGNRSSRAVNEMPKTMKRLREIGLNTVYLECWDNGRTEFPSDVMRKTLGTSLSTTVTLEQPRDLLDESLNAAHREGLICMAWFEFGFAAGTCYQSNPLLEKHPEWLMTTRDGEFSSTQNPFVWMNPLRPECRELLEGIILEAITNYDLDGVQLDDHTAWPVTMGYDPYTIHQYRQEHSGVSPPTNQYDPDWITWRAAKISDFISQLYRDCKAANPKLLVSISPAVTPWAFENYACDWPRWAKAGWSDECVPQDYRFDYNAFAKTWLEQVAAMPSRSNDLVAGILIAEGRRKNSWADLEKEVMLVRHIGASGHVWWYCDGVLNQYADQLSAFYDVGHRGPSPHPKLGLNYRPIPSALTCERTNSNQAKIWSGRDIQAGNYRVIGLIDGVWKTLDHLKVPSENISGAVKVSALPEAKAVELLLDRRPSQ